jgi:hypothetical protein
MNLTAAPSGRRRHAFTAIALLLAVAPQAWSDDPAPAAPSKPAGDGVKLLEAGAEPRAALRFRIPKGQKEKGTATARQTPLSGSAAAPTRASVAILFETKESLPAGAARYDMVLDAITMETGAAPGSSVKKAMDAALVSMKGAMGSVTVSARGQLTDRAFQDPEDVLVFVENAFEGLMLNEFASLGPVRLPEEAVGVGGRWEVAGPLLVSGVTQEVVVVYTLKSREGDRVELDLAITHTGKPQPVPQPRAAPGTKTELVASTSQGAGKLTLDLTHVVPTKGQTKVTSKTTLRTTVGAASTDQTIESEATTEMSGEVVPAAAPGK